MKVFLLTSAILLPLLAFADESATTAKAAAPAAPAAKRDYQYKTDGIFVPAASADEPKVKAFNADTIRAAAKYLDDGAVAWTREKSCISCHTTGAYMSFRPGLTSYLGEPSKVVVESFRERTKGSPREFVYRAVGLAEYDKHVTGSVSQPTEDSLRAMFRIQSADGSWPTTVKGLQLPFTTTDSELTSHAAQAVASAPGWVENLKDDELKRKVELLKTYLREKQPRNDYERVLKLQMAIFFPGLISETEVEEAKELLWKKQHEDGGWSLRDMSDVHNWRENAIAPYVIERLQREPDAAHPVSDAFMTGFAIAVLRGRGTPAEDARIQRGIAWLKSTQRVSGRWWMQSLQTQGLSGWKFSTYFATVQAMRALGACGELAIDK